MNPYKKIIPSKVGVFGENTIQLIIEFTIHEEGVDYSYTPDEAGITITEIGSLEWDLDLEDLLLVPGTMDVKLFDSKSVFDLLINDTEYYISGNNYYSTIEKNATVKLLINSVVEYIGKINIQTINYNKGLKTCEFTVDCNTEILNKQMVYNEEGQPINPFLYNLETQMNLQSIDIILSKIYKLVNPNVNLEFYSNLSFNCYVYNRATEIYEWYVLPIANTQYDVIPLYKNNFYGISNVGDILRNLAKDLGFFTGMTNLNNAFFRQMYSYDETYSQELIKVYEHNINYPFSTIDYVKYHLSFTIITGYLRLIPSYETIDLTYEKGVYTALEGKSFIRDCTIGFYYNNDDDAKSNVGAFYTDRNGYVYQVVNPAVSLLWQSYGDMITSMWYKFKSIPNFGRIDFFVVKGINYDFLKGFIYNGIKYQIIGMKKLITKGITEIKAIYLGA